MTTHTSHLRAELHAGGLECDSLLLDRMALDESMLLRRLEHAHQELARIVTIMQTGQTTRPDCDGEYPVHATLHVLADANTLVIDLLTAQRLANRLIGLLHAAYIARTH